MSELANAYRIKENERRSDEARLVPAIARSKESAFPYSKSLSVTFSRGASVYVPLPDVNSRFGLKLRTLRRERRWTQLEMAVILGINRSYISEIERGHKSISLGMLEVIALGFKMSVAELLQGI